MGLTDGPGGAKTPRSMSSASASARHLEISCRRPAAQHLALVGTLRPYSAGPRPVPQDDSSAGCHKASITSQHWLSGPHLCCFVRWFLSRLFHGEVMLRPSPGKGMEEIASIKR
eukprot:15456-Eustigmatos_ZCMA.PRE.1